MKKLSPKERKLQSIKNDFGGYFYRRIEVSPGVYQCGCKRIYLDNEEVCEGTFVTGDILVECPFHKFITDQELEIEFTIDKW
jgi:hypothetical protein